MRSYTRKPKPKRPPDNLSPEKLQQKWNSYLDAHVGRTGARPRWEVLVNPMKLDAIAFQETLLREIDHERTTRTERVDIYVQACKNVIDKLPLLQRKVLKYYFGIGEIDPMTQEEVSKSLGIAQQNVDAGILRAMRNLKVLIRKEMSRLVKEALRDELLG